VTANGTANVSRAKDHATSDTTRLMLGEWMIDVPARRLQFGERVVMLEPRPMAVLLELCQRPREVINADALLTACWPGEPTGDNPVHKVIAGLRRALQDSATSPQYIETIRKQGYRVVAPIRVLSEQGARSHKGGWRGQSPFRGLEPFGAQHASVFFGRDEAVAALHARLGDQWRHGRQLVVLLGPSGSGKTSLVQAGLLPAMCLPAHSRSSKAHGSASHGQPLRVCTVATAELTVANDADPWSDLAGALLDWECAGTPVLAGFSIDSLAHLLRDRCDEVVRLLRIGLEACAMLRGDDPPCAPPLLALDRLEALFQPGGQADAGAFVACIERLLRSRLVLVLAICRNDFYPGLANHPVLMDGKEHGAHLDLAPPGAEAIAQIIRLPARAADLVYGTDVGGMNRLDDRLCADAMHVPDALPLLQYALQELYLGRGPGGELTWAAYEAMGRLEGAIGHRAEAVLASLPQAQQDALAQLLPRLAGMTVEDTVPTGRWVADSALQDEHERALVQAFVEARLLVADRVACSSGFRVAHEALLRRWPRVTTWVAQHRAGLAAREEIALWIRRWLDAGRPETLLLPRGPTLWQASSAMAEAPSLFGDDERDYLARSHARVQRHARWRMAAAAAVLALAVIAGFAAVGYARLARVAGERERQSERLASFMLGDLADQLRPIGKLDLLRSIGEQGLQLFGDGRTGGESVQDILQRAKALVVIGEVNSSRGQARIDVAVAALRQADRLLASLHGRAGADAVQMYKTEGASAFWQGQIAFDADDLATATLEMERYRQACEQWLKVAPADPHARTEFGFALNSLGSIAFKRGAWSDADRWFEAALAVKLALLAEHPQDTELLDAAANSRFWLALVAHVQGRPALALALEDATRAAQAALLAQHPGEIARLHGLGVTEVRRAESLEALGRSAEALGAMDGALERLRQAARADPSNARWRGEIAHAQAGLLLMRVDAGLPAASGIDELGQAIEHGGVASSTPDLARETAARLATARAMLAAREQDWPHALALAAEAGRRVREVVAYRRENWQGRELQARLGLLEIRAHAALGDAARRVAACERLRDGFRPAIDAGQGGRVLETWLIVRVCSGAGAVDAAGLDRLTAGGYRPADAVLSIMSSLQRGSP
jgi:eukaryotic-like serine/threonine-protein kinase